MPTLPKPLLTERMNISLPTGTVAAIDRTAATAGQRRQEWLRQVLHRAIDWDSDLTAANFDRPALTEQLFVALPPHWRGRIHMMAAQVGISPSEWIRRRITEALPRA